MSNESLGDQVLKAITSIRNNRGRPSLRSILNFIKHENENVSSDEFKSAVYKLMQEGVIYNSPTTGKKESYYINEDNVAITNVGHPVDTDIDEDTLLTPRKSLEEIKSFNFLSNPEARKPQASMIHRSIHDIDKFIEKRVTDEMSPFIEKLEDLLQSYDLLLQQRNILSTRSVDTNINKQLIIDQEFNNKKSDNNNILITTLKDEIAFLRSEIKSKDTIIQMLIKDTPHKHINNNENNIINTNSTEDFIQPKKTCKVNYSNADDNSVPIRNKFSSLNCDDLNNEGNLFDDVANGNPPRTPKHTKSNKKRRNITIFGTSIMKDVKQHKINTLLMPGNKAYVKSFNGATISYMEDYVKPSLRYNPDLIILECGTNDLRSENSPEIIAGRIIKVAEKMKSVDNEIIISGILPRKDDIRLNEKGLKVNESIRLMCCDNGFGYLNNSNIIPDKHLNGSGLHLNFRGTAVLTENLVNVINM